VLHLLYARFWHKVFSLTFALYWFLIVYLMMHVHFMLSLNGPILSVFSDDIGFWQKNSLSIIFSSDGSLIRLKSLGFVRHWHSLYKRAIPVLD
jgi:hypothetical protein